MSRVLINDDYVLLCQERSSQIIRHEAESEREGGREGGAGATQGEVLKRKPASRM